ncbi:hypothetical protein SELMODRAFT_234970 [Selaginella moellendorffii]|uniref:Uncharacterized protein n=2 Tax=Selaginella moellendorffii TaxID=88036 RepID=D8SSB3_SELML|nr:hypothetical protein SELMODRAFT_234970 [Selaginella moellendorffii]
MAVAEETVEQQILVRLLNGSTRCVRFASPRVLCEDLKARVFEIAGIPPSLQRIVTGTREIGEGEALPASRDASCAVLLRLRGGKGGFGSLLRGAATKAGQKKTSNFDACRDMSGRRLRHVNGEKKIKEWNEEAGLRQLEVVAHDYLKKESQKLKNESSAAEDIKKFREEAERKSQEVQEAVLDGLRRAKNKKRGTDGKRKKIDMDDMASKKLRIMSTGKDSDQELMPPPIHTGASSSQSFEDPSVLNPSPEAVPSPAETAKPVEPVEPVVNLQAPQEPPPKVIEEELSFDNFQSAEELETLGMDRLKSELQKRGLKCGGSLKERSARLFLLKTTPVEKLDKKHFAKSK